MKATSGDALSPDRYFAPDPSQRRLARELYESIQALPLISPHGHIDPRLLADENASFGTPTDLFIIPDHYVFRMLYSQGVPLEALGVPQVGGAVAPEASESDHRKIWQSFADHFYLFRGTPSGGWLAHALAEVFGVTPKLNSENAQAAYDEIAEKLASPEFRPRALFKRFNIEVLATTDAATDPLESHRALQASGWDGRVVPTFRPDAVVNLLTPNWRRHIEALSEVSGIHISSYDRFLEALQQRRRYFKSLGGTATDHAAETAHTGRMPLDDVRDIFNDALIGEISPSDATFFAGHMLMEMAHMSTEDGLVMQFHVGSVRNHNQTLHQRFGTDKGADIPQASEFTNNLRPLLSALGNDPRLTLILFTLDETTYARELAPLAGHYPALKLGPPWWFHDSPNGMRRYFDQVIETAGLYNTTGFNDDTRAFCSIPARHDVWRRVSCDWLAGLVVRGQVDEEDAREMAHDLAYGLAKRAYRL